MYDHTDANEMALRCEEMKQDAEDAKLEEVLNSYDYMRMSEHIEVVKQMCEDRDIDIQIIIEDLLS